MLLYNVTVKINQESESDWLDWMKEKHIPDVLATGQFKGARLCQLSNNDGEEESTYVIQYYCESQGKLDRYFNEFAAGLRDEHNQRYKDHFVAWRTVMEVLKEFTIPAKD